MCGSLLGKIVKGIKNIMFNNYDNCYTDMEYQGIAAMGCCCGVVGGTSATEYLSEICVSCPYHAMVGKGRKGG